MGPNSTTTTSKGKGFGDEIPNKRRTTAHIKLFFRRIKSTLCCKAGHFNKALSKGPSSTTSIWNLHADAHDFDSLEIN